MHITFLGPIGCVTGSCYWLRHRPEGGSPVQFLVDCGARQGERDNDAWNKAPLPFDASRIDFVLLTHAHLDHCGLLPRLVQEGFRGDVHCTEATREIARVILLDGAKQDGATYSAEDVERIRFHPIDATRLGSYCRVRGDILVQAYRTAHIYGAVSIRVVWGPREKQRSVTFSGDLGPNAKCSAPMPLHSARQVPPPADYVLIESTYGNRVRPSEEASDAQRLRRLQTAVTRSLATEDSVLLIPCFAVDRLQAVLFDLQRLWWRDRNALSGAQLFVHSTMATRINQIYARHLSASMPSTRTNAGETAELAWCGEATIRELRNIAGARMGKEETLRALACVLDQEREPTQALPRAYRVIRDTSEALQSSGRRIILTTAGMCSGGPVLTYLSALLHNPDTTVLLTGYQSDGTVGRRLQELCERVARGEAVEGHLDLGDRGTVDCRSVKATLGRLQGYSAHADQSGLVSWLLGDSQHRGAAGGAIFLTHGEEDARRGLRDALRKTIQARGGGQVVETPHRPGDAFDLDAGKWNDTDDVTLHAQISVLSRRVAHLEARLVHGGAR